MLNLIYIRINDFFPLTEDTIRGVHQILLSYYPKTLNSAGNYKKLYTCLHSWTLYIRFLFFISVVIVSAKISQAIIFEDFPPEVNINILSLLSRNDRMSTIRTCKKMYDLGRMIVKDSTFIPKTLQITSNELMAAANIQSLFSKIRIDGIKLTPQQFESISANSRLIDIHFMSNNKEMKNSLIRSQLDDVLVESLSKGLKQNLNLKTLYITNNEIKLSGMVKLSKIFKEHTSITHISFYSCRIGDKGIKVLSKALIQYKLLETLLLANNGITNSGISYLSKLLKISTALKKLDISLNEYTNNGVKVLAQALKENTSLTTLSLVPPLYGKQFAAIGAKALSHALCFNKALKILEISFNKIGDEGFAHFCSALEKNTALETLVVVNNNITDLSLENLNKALGNNTTLSSLHIERNPFSTEGLKSLEEIWKAHPTLKNLSFLSP